MSEREREREIEREGDTERERYRERGLIDKHTNTHMSFPKYVNLF